MPQAPTHFHVRPWAKYNFIMKIFVKIKLNILLWTSPVLNFIQIEECRKQGHRYTQNQSMASTAQTFTEFIVT